MVVTLKKRDAPAKDIRMVAANRKPAINPGTLTAGGERLKDLTARTKKTMAARRPKPRSNSPGRIPAERAAKTRNRASPKRPGRPKKKAEKDRERKRKSLSPAGRRWRRLEPGR
jgi:hypothetical protein